MRMTLTRLRALSALADRLTYPEDMADRIYHADDPIHVNQARNVARGMASHGMTRELKDGRFKITALGRQTLAEWRHS